MNPTTATGLALLAHELDGADQQTLRTAYTSARTLRANLDRDGVDLTPSTVLALLVGADLEAKVRALTAGKMMALALPPGMPRPPAPTGHVSRPVRLTLAALARDLLADAGIDLTTPAHDDQEG